MPTTKKRSPRSRARAGTSRPAESRLRQTWAAAVESVIKPDDARKALSSVRSRVAKERRKAAREIDARLATLQVRLHRERKNLTRMVDEAVRATLASLNIPSRREVAALTHKVDALSRKIDGVRRPRRGRTARRPATATAH